MSNRIFKYLMNSSAEPTKAINFNSSASLLTKDLIKDKRTCKRDLLPIFQSYIASGKLEQIKHISFLDTINNVKLKQRSSTRAGNSKNCSNIMRHD